MPNPPCALPTNPGTCSLPTLPTRASQSSEVARLSAGNRSKFLNTTRSTMKSQSGKIQNVRGLIEPGELGPTLMHEHVVTDYTPPGQRNQPEVKITLENHFELT